MTAIRSLVGRVRRRLVPNRYYRDPRSYWEQRHESFGTSLEGVGRIHMSEADNERAYETKWEHLDAALRSVGEPGDLLDAGCGSGWFTQRFVDRGYSVTAFDFTASGIAAARDRVHGDVTWVVSDIASFPADRARSVVVCIDVLFHIVDDEAWRAAVTNLGALAAGGRLVIQDHLVDEPEPLPSGPPGTFHTRWRTLADYQSVLAGAVLDLHDHYELPTESTTKDLLVFSVPGPDSNRIGTPAP